MFKLLSSIFVLCTVLSVATNTLATPITGEELNDSFNATSTNALNYASGWKPYVIFISNDVGSVTLEFHNNSGYNAYFERRIDGATLTSGTAHYFIAGDYVYPYFSLATGGVVQTTYTASDIAEIRFAFGPENDWFFDWTTFNAAPATAVPEPATMLLLGFGLIGLAGFSTRRKK